MLTDVAAVTEDDARGGTIVGIAVMGFREEGDSALLGSG
jgi:hypothetical protein